MLIDDDPLIARKRIMHTNPDGTITIQSQYDLSAVVEKAKEDAKELHGKRFKGDGMHHVGVLPWFAIEELRRSGALSERGYDVIDQKKLAQWLSENNYFRTRVL